jgi:trimethylamine:corrinoid methyltransferase-like protein
MQHYKEPYYSKLADKNQYSVWQKRGATTMEERAATMVDNLLKKREPEALPLEVQAEIKKIVQREQAWIDNQT